LACCGSLFLLVDSGFFVANALKIIDGGYVPAARRSGLRRDDDLAPRDPCGGPPTSASDGFRAGIPRRTQRSPRAWHGGVSHPRDDRRTAAYAVARAAQQGAARASFGTHGAYMSWEPRPIARSI
jgi:hypothetical protein